MDDITRHEGLRWIGALQVADNGRGLRPNRIPPASEYQLLPSTRWAAVQGSGVHLVLRSDTTSLRLVGSPLWGTYVGYDAPPPRIDVLVDGALAGRAVVEGGTLMVIDPFNGADTEFRKLGDAAVEFTGLAAGMKDIEIWLPHGAGYTLRELAVDPGSAIEPTPRRPTWIHHGSSISQSAETDGPSEIWTAVAARRAGLDTTSLGFGGECHIDQFVARYIRDTPADVISLKLGINTYTSLDDRSFPSAVHGFLDTVRDGHATTPVVVCSPIYCPVAETAVGPLIYDDGKFRTTNDPPTDPVPGMLTLQRMREILEGIVESRRSLGDEHLHYLSGLELLDENDVADLPDLLHPNTAGYARMGERFAAKVFGPTGLLSGLLPVNAIDDITNGTT